MPETPRGLWYPSSTDDANVPADMKKLADGVDGLLGEVALNQIVAGADGQIPIVKDGVLTHTTVGGDATLSETGSLQLGSKVVGTNELGDKAVTAAKLDADSVTAEKIAASAVGESEVADGAIASRKAKLTAGVLTASEALTLTTAYVDIPGLKLDITPAVPSKLIVTATFVPTNVAAENYIYGLPYLDGVAASAVYIRSHFGKEQDTPITASWEIALSAAPHTVTLRAKKELVANALVLGKIAEGPALSRMQYELYAA